MRSTIQRARDDDRVYGQLEVEGNSSATVISGASSNFSNAIQVTIFDTDGASNRMTPANATDDITVEYDGMYLLTARLNLTGTASNDVSAAIFRNNGGDQITPRATKAIDSVDADAELTIQGIHQLADGETIELWIQNETGTDNITVVDAVLTLLRL